MRFLRGAFIICVFITICNFKYSLYAKPIDSLIAKAERLEKSEKFKAAYENATKALGHINESTSEKEILRVYELVLRLAWDQNMLNDTEAHAIKLLENYSGPEIDFLGYRYLGHAYMELGNLEKAIENYHRALSEGNGGTEEANIHFNLGALYQELDNVDDSVLSYKKAIQILKVQDDSKEELSFVFFNLGLVQEINSDYPSAFSSYQQCIELIKSNSLDHAFLVDAIDRICTVSKLIKKHEECLKFLRFKRKLILDSDEKDVIELLKINFSISEIFYYQNRYKDALNEIEKVFIQKELFKKTDFDFYGDIILNITAYLLELHRPYEVINILNQEINDFTGDLKLISDWYATLGISYFYLKDYNNSEKVLLKAIELVETSEDETPDLHAYHTLCGVYSRIGKFDKANEAVQNYIDKSLKFYGKLSEDYAHALFQKSIISLEQENLDEGISITKRVIQLYNEIHGNQNIYNLIPYRNLAMAFYIKEEYKNSKESLISSMEIISKQKQFDHPDAIYCYDFYAELLVIEKNFTEAINFSR
jgi:tetratricopeptide (TPR) repeat protein